MIFKTLQQKDSFTMYMIYSLFHGEAEELLEPGAVVDHAGGAREGDDELLGEPVQPRREPLDPVARLRLRAGVEAELAHQRRQAARQVRHELVAPRQAAQVTLGPEDINLDYWVAVPILTSTLI